MNPSAGKFLISDPFLLDPNFNRTVVYLTGHNEDGSIGFVMNRATALTLEDVLPDFAGIKVPLFYGGPVEQNTLHFIHCCPALAESSGKIADGVFWGGDLEQVVAMLRIGAITEKEIRFFIGYSGWAAGQLDDELAEKAWFVGNSRNDYIFSDDPETLWKQVLGSMGQDFAMLINSPMDPRWN